MIEQKAVTVLYVDDEDANLFLFEVNFRSKYKIFTAKSGFEGLEALDVHHDEIIVVISDMRMPQMNGVDFVKKAKEKYNNIAYFILTGFDFDNEIEKALQENIIHKFFTKPFEMSEIEKAIEEVINKMD